MIGSMLVPLPTARKDSLRRRANGRRGAGRDAPDRQIFSRRSLEDPVEGVIAQPEVAGEAPPGRTGAGSRGRFAMPATFSGRAPGPTIG